MCGIFFAFSSYFIVSYTYIYTIFLVTIAQKGTNCVFNRYRLKIQPYRMKSEVKR